jgi:hypothetical protein
MRPVRSIATVVLTAAVAATGSYIAYSTAHPSAAASATTVAPTTPADSPASTTTRALNFPTNPTHPAPAPTPRISDPALAARHLFDAWQARDRQHALQAASATAVRALFAISPSPDHASPAAVGMSIRSGSGSGPHSVIKPTSGR